MKISDLFILHQGNGFELCNMAESEKSRINFVSRTAQNNGVVARVQPYQKVEPFPAGFLSVALGGSVLSAFVQTRPFYTAFHIMVLEPKKLLSVQEKMFYCLCIQKNAYRYSYGRQANKTLKNIEIPDKIPEWVNQRSIFPVTTGVQKGFHPILTANWKEYRLSELFSVSVSNDSNLQNSSAGKIPYVASSSDYNGVTAYVNALPAQRENTLTIARNGSVGSVFYQNRPYCASPDDVRILTPKFKMNVYNALFIKTVIEQEKFRYTYGRKLGTKRIQNLKIRLPAKKNGKPDFDYMTQYIQSLPYSDKI